METSVFRLKNLFMIPVVFALIFLIPSFISYSNKNFLQMSVNMEVAKTDLLLKFMSNENAHLQLAFKNKQSNFLAHSIKIWEDFTNIRIDDLRSFYQLEIPGFSFNINHKEKLHTFESPPPMEELMTERRITETALNAEQEVNAISSPNNKKIFIYHTHNWESYNPSSGQDSTQKENEKINITTVGDLLSKALEKRKINSIVDKTNIEQELQKKGWNTYKSYQLSRDIVKTVMAKNNDVEYFIDIHRDSTPKKQSTIMINQKSYAKLMFVIGEDNKQYEKNVRFADTLHQFLENSYPGVSLGVNPKKGPLVDGVYNQDLSPNLLVIEVGGVENNLEEIKNTVNILAEAISQQYWKAIEVNGTN
ncbi:stage II sporulation protein P [Bacillus sp. CGMCC 1.16607]|uniref:stage II sporulation protein P n=1 Tax=Bacillus sp. CGMCC 1.16607 TaxID=3351842 RepID=UPI00362B5795